jgi:ribosomal protein S6
MEDTTQEKGAQTVYEIGYLVLPSIAEDKVSDVAKTIKELVAKEGGNVFDGEEPIKMDLAYTMNKTIGASRYVVNEAYVGWLKFEAESSRVLKIKALVEKMDEILRFLLIKAPRETTFTFAEALRAMEERNAPQAEAGEEVAAESAGAAEVIE